MGIKQVYRKKGMKYTKSYNAIDIISGRAIGVFYGGQATDTNFLSTAAMPSNEPIVSLDTRALTTSYVRTVEIDFDAEFQVPTTIDGRAYILVTGGLSSAVVGTKYLYIKARIRKKPAGAEIEIIDNDSDVLITTSADGTPHSERFCIDVDIPKTSFKIGESLRLTIEVWAKASAAIAVSSSFAHDPSNRNDPLTPKTIEDTDDTTLIGYLPFIVEL